MPRPTALAPRLKVLVFVALMGPIASLGLRPLLANALADLPDKSQSPGPPPIEARILVPLNGTKTTFRFQVINNGKATAVFPPFTNDTRFLFTDPDGKPHALSAMAENASREGLAAGETRSWDIDVAGNIKFIKKGNYKIAFVINGVQSNEITLAVDEIPAPAK